MWWISRNGVLSGPFPRDQIEKRIKLGLIVSLDRVSEDKRNWTYIRDTEFWHQERTIPEPIAPPRPGSMGKIGLGPRHPTIAATPMSPTSPSAPVADMGYGAAPQLPQPDAKRTAPPNPWKSPEMPRSNAAQGSRPRMSGPALAIISALGTLVAVFAVIFILAIRSYDEGGDMTQSPSGDSASDVPNPAQGQSGITDDGFRGTEVKTLDLSAFETKFHPFLRYITPSYSDLKQAFAMVENSEHVSDNLQYKDALANVRLYHDPSDGSINAFATIADPYRNEFWPTMVVLGGAGRFSRIIGAALAEERSDDLADLLAVLGQAGNIDNAFALRLLSNGLNIPLERFSDQAWLANAKNISRGILLSVLAHEAGHLALGHVWSWKKNNERSRNQEREADSFSHSVASGTADAEIMFFGNFVFDFAFAIHEGKNGDSEASRTHPYSEERLFNLLRDNTSTAVKLGFTEREVREMLTEARANLR